MNFNIIDKEEYGLDNALTLALFQNYQNDIIIEKYFNDDILNEFSKEISNFYSKEEKNINESTTFNYDYNDINNNNNDIKENKNESNSKDTTNINTNFIDENIDNNYALIMNPIDSNNLDNSLIFLNNDKQNDFYK